MGQPESPQVLSSLVRLLARDHELLMQMCRAAIEADNLERWQQLVASDTFLAMGSRHLAAVEDVLYPAMRRQLPDGKAVARRHAREARGIERTMRRILASMHGEVHDLDAPRETLWSDTRSGLESHLRAEEVLAAAVEQGLSADERKSLADAYLARFVRAPTRPHPYTPHAGPLGRLARALWAAADRVLDVMDNREASPDKQSAAVIYGGVRERPQTRVDLMTQYLTGRPQFDTSEQPPRDERP